MARLSLHLSKCHIVGNPMSRLIFQIRILIWWPTYTFLLILDMDKHDVFKQSNDCTTRITNELFVRITLANTNFLHQQIIKHHSMDIRSLRMGVQWLSGRVLDSRSRGRGFDPHWHHCVVSLSKTH